VNQKSAELIQQLAEATGKFWQKLIQVKEATGNSSSKAVAKLYANWFRSARNRKDATLEVDEDDMSIIESQVIRIDLTQLKNWVVRHIASLPQKHCISMIKCCKRYLNLNEAQAAALCRTFFGG
jgi:hypothetical protein